MVAGKRAIVIGGGLAGSESAWQLAQRGVEVELYEMRPELTTPAHVGGELAELVCSNSLRSRDVTIAAGLLKEELMQLGSLLISSAYKFALPAGGALAVDRKRFSRHITKTLEKHPHIKIVRQEMIELPESTPTIIATGPLTSDRLAAVIKELLGERYLYFYDAISPTVTTKSVNMERAFIASRYGKGDSAYINCPLDEKEYDTFYSALIRAEPYPRRQFELDKFFEGCLPIEELARREKDAIRFGPLKPVGLVDPQTDKRPYAVVQLRPEDKGATLYNMVGFQTRLRHNDQREIFSLIPALEEAEFVRLGSSHRNTYINSPHHLEKTLQLKGSDNLWFAGQMVGVEGYCESIAMGLVCGLNLFSVISKKKPISFPPTTMVGALLKYITTVSEDVFQPMNVSFGLLPPLAKRMESKKAKREAMSKRALADLAKLVSALGITSYSTPKPSRVTKAPRVATKTPEKAPRRRAGRVGKAREQGSIERRGKRRRSPEERNGSGKRATGRVEDKGSKDKGGKENHKKKS